MIKTIKSYGEQIVICPVCSGKKKVKDGFYDGIENKNSKLTEKCQTCDGEGIICILREPTIIEKHIYPLQPWNVPIWTNPLINRPYIGDITWSDTTSDFNQIPNRIVWDKYGDDGI